MNIFEILGPVMVGPSSSHTAGAVRIGLISRKLLGGQPVSASIVLHGSFADTGIGHGTDKALIAGLLGMEPDDMRIPDSFRIADEQGLSYHFISKQIRGAHPNTALLTLTDSQGQSVVVQASSLGGGRILVNRLNGMDVQFSGDKTTLVVQNLDEPGMLADITCLLSSEKINIATLQLYRSRRGGYALTIAETDSPIPDQCLEGLRELRGILQVTYLE